MFERFTEAMDEKYEEKRKEKGDSWKDMEIHELLSILYEEIEELRDAQDMLDPKEVLGELTDVGNLCRMTYEKIHMVFSKPYLE